jgi:3',5'-cyclic AMP phosphodiesterase CpdA
MEPQRDAKAVRVLRIAHLSDIHVQPERGAVAGFASCLLHVHSLADPPDLILNSGDTIMDAVGADLKRATLQWDLFDSVMRDHCRLPMLHCLGNHDIWGWNRRRSGCLGSEPLFGKALPLQRLRMPAPYYRVDRAGWRFIVLDSNFDSISEKQHTEAAHFTARLDDTQFSWLARELHDTPPEMPVILVSHCPLLGAASLFFSGGPGETERTGNWVIPSSWMHIDARDIVALLIRFPNVRLCVSGHTHLDDRTEYAGITFINNGAVSGRWWRNDNRDPPPTYSLPGYGLIDLFADGSFTNVRIPFPPGGGPARP